MARKSKIIIDGRVFSSEAHDRGVGRYVRFLIHTIAKSCGEVGLIMYKDSRLDQNDELFKLCKEHYYIDINPDEYNEGYIHQSSVEIESILRRAQASCYIDATPFMPPMRLGITVCPVLAFAYDLIPLRYPKYYLPESSLPQDYYKNALRRLCDADRIIAISEYTKSSVCRYLGVAGKCVDVIYPCLDDSYLVDEKHCYDRSTDLFAIIGHHHSKNPEGALTLLSELMKRREVTYTLCVPTKSQLTSLQMQFPNELANLNLSPAISEEEKLAKQAQAKVVLHMSREEGFGIPLLEALFRNSRVVCSDIRINREIVEKANADTRDVVLFIDHTVPEEDVLRVEEFIHHHQEGKREQAFENIRAYFKHHWSKEAPEVAAKAIKGALEEHSKFQSNVIAKMVSNTPGGFCGVADYAASIPLGTKKNMVVYTSENVVKNIDALESVIVKSHLCFEHDRDHNISTIFHLAVSARLWAGLELLRLYGGPRDVVIIHDHLYLYGIYHMYFYHKSVGEFLENYFVGADAYLKRSLESNKHLGLPEFAERTSGYKSAWLTSSKVKLLTHLTQEVAEAASKLQVGGIGDKQHYVDIGIPDGASSLVARIARAWRISNGITNHDFVVGVFGSVTDNKYIPEVSEAVSRLCAERNLKCGSNSVIHMLLSGTVHDNGVLKHLKRSFKDQGVSLYMHFANPIEDYEFNGLMAAADVVICCRRQDRGQLSHILPRAFSLGRPLIANRDSGYTMVQEEFVIPDEEFADRLYSQLSSLLDDREKLRAASRFNRNLFETKYNISRMVGIILNLGSENEA